MLDRIKNILNNPTNIQATDQKAVRTLSKTFGHLSKIKPFLTKFKEELQNLGETIAEDPSLPFTLLGNSFEGLNQVNSELNYRSYDNIGDVIGSVKTAFVPSPFSDSTTPYGEEFVIGSQPEAESERWFFVNGIATSEAVAKLNGKALSETFNRPIHVLYNPSQGIPIDLYESISERSYDRKTPVTDSIHEIIKEELKTGRKIKLLGHSQGGIIVGSVIDRLVDDPEMQPYLKNIEHYTFGSAADKIQIHREETLKAGHPVPYGEHYYNNELVAKIGFAKNNESSNVLHFTTKNETAGHLMNAHYIDNLKEGKYVSENGEHGQLYNYMQKNNPDIDFTPAEPSQDNNSKKRIKND